jgi:formylglycine-generating enzyme required for sulfatase activity/Tfp pilus assembly protein PilF
MGRRQSFCPILLTVIALLLFSPARASDDDWQDCSADAPERSIAGCSRIITAKIETPAHLAMAYNNRGLAYQWKGEILRAFSDFTEALELNPTYARAFYNRGLAHLQNNSLARALEDFDAALDLEPDYPKALASRGLLVAEYYDVDEGLSDFERAFKLDRNLVLPEKKDLAEKLANYVTDKMRMGSDFDRQFAGLTAAIKLGFDAPDVRNARAEVLLEQRAYADAIADLDQALKSFAQNAKYLANRCQAYTGIGDLSKAGGDCDQSVRIAPKYAFAFTSRGMLFSRQNKLIEAQRDFTTAIQLSPTDLGNFVVRGQTYEALGQAANAIADYRTALSLKPESARDVQDRAAAQSALEALTSGAGGRNAPQLAAVPGTKQVSKGRKAGEVFSDCEGCPIMVVVPAGEFAMGSPASEAKPEEGESPQHAVKIAQAFAVGRFEITAAQFEEFVKASKYKFGERCNLWTGTEWKELPGSFRETGFVQTPQHPAACINWSDAQAYIAWLGQRSGRPYRLLTEAEWEYSARGRSTTRYYFGNDADKICEFANVADRTAKEKYTQWTVANCADGFVNTSPVGSFKPNAFGLYDMHGNVSEWVEDCYRQDYRGASNDAAAANMPNCPLRVLRGGSWIGHPKALRSASRLRRSPEDRYSNIGFRVARNLLADELGSAVITAQPLR